MAEKEYIERGAVISCILELNHNLAGVIQHINEHVPAADVVEVVRCKDCKYKDDCTRRMVHTTRDYVLEQNISTYNKVDFCSYGERKEQK